MAGRGSRSWTYRLSVLGATLLGLLWILNLPFYSGAGGVHWRWRMEHGRIRIERRSEITNPETFYIAWNSEGLKFAPEWNFHGRGWMVNVPLWIPWVACVGLAIWRRRRLSTPGPTR